MSTSVGKQVLILGGGFGGLYAALGLEKTLARGGDVQITLINRENCSLFTPMLHEVAASDLDMTHIVNPVRKLLKHVQFFHGEVQHIDLPSKQVTVVHGPERVLRSRERSQRHNVSCSDFDARGSDIPHSTDDHRGPFQETGGCHRMESSGVFRAIGISI